MNTLRLFGKKLKDLRRLNKYTQEQLAELVDLDPKQICRIENGVCFTTFDTLEKIAKVFDTEIHNLFLYEHKQNKEKLITEINELLKIANDEKIELIYKIVKDIIY